MTFTLNESLLWMEKLISVAVLLQSIEMIQIRKATSAEGIWTWDTLQKDYRSAPPPFQRLMNFLLRNPNFVYLNGIQFVAAAIHIFLPNAVSAGIFVFCALMSALRWRGAFNGGSDSMTLMVLLAVGFSYLGGRHPVLVNGCLWYVTIQVSLSYFLGGLGKLQEKNWRNGTALASFLKLSAYNIPPRIQIISEMPRSLFLLSWSVLLFECSFPLAFLNPRVCAIYLGLAFIFHLANVYIFGLNRFLYAWAAAYPALYYCCTQIEHFLKIS